MYSIDSNGKALYNSKYFSAKENKNLKPIYYKLQNPKLIYLRLQNSKSITNFYISS